ncbi:hypothetical protein FNV43_RR05896 [Rhamnella rubrinervis]|uniref:Uncharacterized protein n=1 Tax=Rhamnella rubrinervis TaxID=2594499 RepID=A0A8K0HC33_9ROSA|nr:hypothetical protein FNV43_RR05896 [Rhamnella rubrinervis]
MPLDTSWFVLDFQDYKSENAQLEELLFAERELSKSYEARIKQLQQDLSVSKNDVTRVESNMAEALAIKNSEIEALALREEQASAKRRAEEKHAAHNASKMVCFHGKGSGIRTKSSRGVYSSCKNPGAIDHDASVFAEVVDFLQGENTNSCHDVNAFESRFICLPLISWS